MSTATKTRAGLTIETLETMFLYLGCANIHTAEAMDGAVPMESFINCGGTNDDVVELSFDRFVSMPPVWSSKLVTMSNSVLSLATASSVHWTKFNRMFTAAAAPLKYNGAAGDAMINKYIAETDQAIEFYYSEIDEHGRFVKFPVAHRWKQGLLVKKLYNPSWLCVFGKERMQVLRSDSDEVYKKKKLSFLAPFACGVEQSKRGYWQVLTKFDTVCPRLTLLTDATGVKDFWKLRDIPEGRKRRDALLHWVSDHWRKDRTDPDVEVYVRRHMRGSEDIKQGQFEAKVTPSEVDKFSELLAKESRKVMRDRKEDRRLRQKRLELAKIAGVQKKND